MGSISDLRIIETLGNRVRLAWTGVRGATGYKIVLRNTQGEYLGELMVENGFTVRTI